MSVAIFDTDHLRADAMIVQGTNTLRLLIATALADERERCAQLVHDWFENADSSLDGEALVAAIRALRALKDKP